MIDKWSANLNPFYMPINRGHFIHDLVTRTFDNLSQNIRGNSFPCFPIEHLSCVNKVLFGFGFVLRTGGSEIVLC